MLTIKQAKQFSEVLVKNELYKDASHIDKYILLASNSPIEKHAGLWDWVGGKLSGWSKRIFFKNFRQAYSLATEIQKELDDHMGRVDEQFGQTKMYLARHDLINWQRAIAELGINITPSERLANLQNRYNDSLKEMNKGVGLLSDEQKEELKKEQKKQKKPAPSTETPGDTTPVAEDDSAEKLDEIPRIKNPEEMTADQLKRLKMLLGAPSEDYARWNRSIIFYNKRYATSDYSNVARIAIPKKVFDYHVDNSHFNSITRDDGKKYFMVNQAPSANLSNELKNTVAAENIINAAWVQDGELTDKDGNSWIEFAQVDRSQVDMFHEDLVTPKTPEEAVRIENTADYEFFEGDSGSIYLPRKQFEAGLSEGFVELTPDGDIGPVKFVKLVIDAAHPEWKNILRWRGRDGKILRCEYVSDDWIKINKITVTTMKKELGIRTPSDMTPEVESEVELEDIDVPESEDGEESKTAKRLDKIIALAMMM